MKTSRAYADRQRIVPKKAYSSVSSLRRPVQSEPAGCDRSQTPRQVTTFAVSPHARFRTTISTLRKYSEFATIPKESKISYVGRFDSLRTANLEMKKTSKIASEPHRAIHIEATLEPNQYEGLINEYQRFVDMELARELSPAERIKKHQIEAELDAIESKQAVEARGESPYRSDIRKLTQLIEIAKTIRTLI